MVATRIPAHRTSLDSTWSRNQRRLIHALRARVAAKGWRGVSSDRTTPGKLLASFVERMRTDQRKGRMPGWLLTEFESLPGWPPNRSALLAKRHAAGHRRALELLKRYVASHGWDGIGNSLVYRGVKLGCWVSERRKEHRRGNVQPWIAAELEAIPGWSWEPFHDRQQVRIAALRDYVKRNGWFDFTENRSFQIVHQGVNLSDCVHMWRKSRRHGHPPVDMREIESIPGWRWESGRASFEAYVRVIKVLIAQTPARERDRVITDVVTVMLWARNLRQTHALGQVEPWLARALKKVPGWSWS